MALVRPFGRRATDGPAGLMLRLAGDGARPVEAGAGLRLTAREREIVQALAEGLSAKEVAQRLNLAPKTVECHIERLRLKTGSKNRIQMVVIALRAGLVA